MFRPAFETSREKTPYRRTTQIEYAISNRRIKPRRFRQIGLHGGLALCLYNL